MAQLMLIPRQLPHSQRRNLVLSVLVRESITVIVVTSILSGSSAIWRLHRKKIAESLRLHAGTLMPCLILREEHIDVLTQLRYRVASLTVPTYPRSVAALLHRPLCTRRFTRLNPIHTEISRLPKRILRHLLNCAIYSLTNSTSGVHLLLSSMRSSQAIASRLSRMPMRGGGG
jgi:hypothetical protein